MISYTDARMDIDRQEEAGHGRGQVDDGELDELGIYHDDAEPGGISVDEEGIWKDDGAEDYIPGAEGSQQSANISEFEASESVHEGGQAYDDHAASDGQSLQSVEEYDYPELRDDSYVPSEEQSRKASDGDQVMDNDGIIYEDYELELEHYDDNEEEEEFDEFGLPAIKFVTKEGRLSQPQFRILDEALDENGGLVPAAHGDFETLEGALRTLDDEAGDNRDLVAAYLENLQQQEAQSDGDVGYDDVDHDYQQHGDHVADKFRTYTAADGARGAYRRDDRYSRDTSPLEHSISEEEAFSVDVPEGTEGSVASIEEGEERAPSAEYSTREGTFFDRCHVLLDLAVYFDFFVRCLYMYFTLLFILLVDRLVSVSTHKMLTR